MIVLGQWKERRRERRIQTARPVYVEADGSCDQQFEEVRATRNLGRWGFYFVTERASYKAGMQVHAIPAYGSINSEYDGEVVRVEQLPGGKFGVAIQLVCVRDCPSSRATATRSMFHSLAFSQSSDSRSEVFTETAIDFA
jgi:hypothetical protein